MSLTDALGNTTTFTYEPVFNKIASITDALGDVTSFTYDRRGNLITVANPEGQATTFAYDAHGLRTSLTDALGDVTTFDYDGAGNLMRITDPLGKTSTFTVDAVSRLIAATDPRGKTTQFTYDGLNRLIATTDSLGGINRFAYDPVGNLLSVTDALGHTTTQDYDDMNRLVRRTDPLGASETFEYDADGNLIRHVDRKGQVSTFDYDALNRLTKAIYEDATLTYAYDARGRLVDINDTSGAEVLRGYDPLGRLLEERTTTGTVTYQYDALGRRTVMEVSGQDPVDYAYDKTSRVTQITQGTQIADFDHDPLGRRTKLVLPNGVRTSYQYDAASRLIQLTYANPDGLLGNLTYAYDAAGNRTQVGGSFARTLLPAVVASAAYDADNRQLLLGNREMTYDANGNLTELSQQSSVTALNWNARNQLKTISGPETDASYEYDPLGRRSRRTVNMQATTFTYDRADVVSERKGGIPKGVLRSTRVDEQIDRDASEYYLADGLGSIIALTNAMGRVIDTYTYSPFGNTQHTGSSDSSYQFTGRVNDNVLGIYYYRSRYYAPQLSRFLSQDPLGISSRDINLYRYAVDNPLLYTDPSGHQVFVAAALIGAAFNVGGLLVEHAISGCPVSGAEVFNAAVAGAAGAALGVLTGGIAEAAFGAAFGAGVGASAGGGVAGGVVNSVTTQLVGGGSVKGGETIVAGVLGGIGGAALPAIEESSGSKKVGQITEGFLESQSDFQAQSLGKAASGGEQCGCQR